MAALMLHANMVAFMLRVSMHVDEVACMLHVNMHVVMLQTCFMCHLQLRYVEPPVAAMLLGWPSEQHNVV